MKERVYRSPEPFHWEGEGARGGTAIMLIHGFTGSPSEFRRIGYFLNDFGYTVNGLCLPGHGTTPEDMLGTRWQHWYEHVIEIYEELKRKPYRKVIVLGHSMGGLLALKLAAERPVDGVVSLAAPFYLWSKKPLFAYPLQYVKKYVSKKPTLSSNRFEEVIAYGKTPIACVASLHKLTHKVKRLLPCVEVPLLIGQGEKDRVVAPRSAIFAYEKAGSRLKELVSYPQSSHSLLQDVDRDAVYEDVLRFVRYVERNETARPTGRALEEMEEKVML